MQKSPIDNNLQFDAKYWVPTLELRVMINIEGQQRLEQKYLDKNKGIEFMWKPIEVYYEHGQQAETHH